MGGGGAGQNSTLEWLGCAKECGAPQDMAGIRNRTCRAWLGLLSTAGVWPPPAPVAQLRPLFNTRPDAQQAHGPQQR